ncbi:hypothetical protein HK099_002472, partial [Clydaea vesicula]
MFQSVLKPTRVKPFYFKCLKEPEKFDVTLTTMITVDRFNILLNSMATFDGFFSVVMHIKDDEALNDNLNLLKSFIKNHNKEIQDRLDIHLIIDKFSRQLNYFRNVARLFSRTDLILPLDIDFIINRSFLSNLKKNKFVINKLLSGEGLFIIPAFEYTYAKRDTTLEHFPQTKKEVIGLYNFNDLEIFHGPKNHGHLSTDYEKWIRSKDRVYQIQPTNAGYEPYAVLNKNKIPWSDERFIGYGGNKCAWWYEIFLSGVNFYILPNDFVIHQYHEYPSVRTVE